ncbi:choice-of-anchor D domain-containing protein [Candidatus Villigracilis saccharophilus]|uniref:choice-of-anchor D domain-containing protein n=1 Tax=Candidatus Villigracilis saccharophilus TaxID=3140684 RepID=UPI003135AE0C|nr:choice-of-anchor D domain-containing protein [Anaerolineales bacterium]
MKTSTIKSQERKKSIWDYLSRHFGKSFWILTILSVSCTANAAAASELPLTDSGSEAKIAFAPDQIDFGVLPFGTPSAAQTVTIGNAGTAPLLIENLSVSSGFSIASNSCPQAPKAIASQGSCVVDVVFMASLPENWVGYLQVNYGSGQAITIQLKGSAHSGMEMLASILP